MGKSSKVGKMRFYPMPAAWLEFARSTQPETSLPYDTPIPVPLPRAIPSAAFARRAARQPGEHALQPLSAD